MTQPDDDTTRLTCHAPHPVIHASSGTVRYGTVRCGGFIGYAPDAMRWVEWTTRAPEDPEGDMWVRCTDKKCRAWNRFRVAKAAAA